MNFSNLHSVVSKEVMPLELEVTTSGVESQYHSVIVKELLLRLNASTTKLLLQELKELWVLLGWDGFLIGGPAVFWARLCFSLVLLDVLLEIKI